MTEATKNADAQAYKQAKADRTDALAAAELFLIKLGELEREPLVSRKEYETTTEALMSALKAEDDAAFKKIEKLSNHITFMWMKCVPTFKNFMPTP